MTLTDLYEQHEQPLQAYALRLTRDPELTADLVQETFMRCLGHLPLLEQLGAPQRRAWLSQTLKHLFLDRQLARQQEQAALRAGLDQLAVCGQLLCPEPLVPIVREKLTDLCGVLQTYEADMALVIGDLRLDAAYVTALPDDSALAVIGHLHAPDVLDATVLERKLKGLSVLGKLSCREENLAAFRRVLTGPPPHVVAIPAGVPGVGVLGAVGGAVTVEGVTAGCRRSEGRARGSGDTKRRGCGADGCSFPC